MRWVPSRRCGRPPSHISVTVLCHSHSFPFIARRRVALPDRLGPHDRQRQAARRNDDDNVCDDVRPFHPPKRFVANTIIPIKYIMTAQCAAHTFLLCVVNAEFKPSHIIFGSTHDDKEGSNNQSRTRSMTSASPAVRRARKDAALCDVPDGGAVLFHDDGTCGSGGVPARMPVCVCTSKCASVRSGAVCGVRVCPRVPRRVSWPHKNMRFVRRGLAMCGGCMPMVGWCL